MNNKIITLLVVGSVAISLSAANDLKLGFKEQYGTNVAQGATASVDGDVIMAPEATLVKSGEGTLTVPMGKIDTLTPYNVVVTGGKLELTGGEEAQSETAPDWINQKAAFWVDATDLENGALATWYDKRDTEKAATQYCSAIAQNRVTLADGITKEPVVESTNGVKGVYFGGYKGKYMRFKQKGSDKFMDPVSHYFIVHSPYKYFGALLGKTSDGYPRTDGFKLDISGVQSGKTLSTQYALFTGNRMDLDIRHGQARFYLNGLRFDPYADTIEAGPQLMEADMLAQPMKANLFMYNHCETHNNDSTKKALTTACGDYLNEVIIFTNKLTEAERLDVERYLMRKWKLPGLMTRPKEKALSTCDAFVARAKGTGKVTTAKGASVEVNVPAGKESVPLAFAGEGDVVKKGEGAMVLGAGDMVQGQGNFDLQEGSILLRGGNTPPLKIKANEKWTSTTTAYGTIYQHTNSTKIVKATLGKANAAQKSGSDIELRVGQIDGAVKRFTLDSGTLNLAARELASTDVAADGATEVYIQNHDFEDDFSPVDANNRRYFGGDSFHGWRRTRGSASSVFSIMTTGYPGFDAWTSFTVPSGTNCVMLIQDGAIGTDVTMPRAGEYELTLFANSRYGIYGYTDTSKDSSAYKRVPVQVKFNNRVVGTLLVAKGQFQRYAVRFTVNSDEVGEAKVLEFDQIRAPTDPCVLMDDLHLRLVPVKTRTNVVKVPGGDFEGADVKNPADWNKGMPWFFTSALIPNGWTITIDSGSGSRGCTNCYMGAINAGTPTYHGGCNRTALYPSQDQNPGFGALGFFGKYGNAQSGTFTLPKGKWVLACKGAMRKLSITCVDTNSAERSYTDGWPTLKATIVNGSTETSLGTLQFKSGKLESHYWPTPFEVTADEGATISLKLKNTNQNACGVVDDLEFYSLDGALPEFNLIENPGFEYIHNGEHGWETYSRCLGVVGKSHSHNMSVYQQYDNEYSYAWGTATCGGYRRGRMSNDAGIRCSITFPVAGLYRFSGHFEQRSDEGTMADPAYVYYTDNAAYTNDIMYLKTPVTRHWIEYSRLFRVPTAGTFSFCIVGIGVKDWTDRTTFVDDISVTKVEETAQLKPTVSADMSLRLAADTRLVLDYEGDLQVGSLWVNGVRKPEGTYNASNLPDVISGLGTLNVVNTGLQLFIK